MPISSNWPNRLVSSVFVIQFYLWDLGNMENVLKIVLILIILAFLRVDNGSWGSWGLKVKVVMGSHHMLSSSAEIDFSSVDLHVLDLSFRVTSRPLLFLIFLQIWVLISKLSEVIQTLTERLKNDYGLFWWSTALFSWSMLRHRYSIPSSASDLTIPYHQG
jgi:hypothetical protein